MELVLPVLAAQILAALHQDTLVVWGKPQPMRGLESHGTSQDTARSMGLPSDRNGLYAIKRKQIMLHSPLSVLPGYQLPSVYGDCYRSHRTTPINLLH